MEQLTQLVQQQISTGSSDISAIIELITEKGKILDLVECMASALTDTNLEVRTKGTALLSNVMHKYPAKKMTSSEVEHLVLFYCDRLHDHHSVQPVVIYGLLGLISFQAVADSMVVKLLQSIFAEVHVQSLVQADRKNIYNIFSNLLITKCSVLQSSTPDFLLGFIQAMDGESDPRNLLICFANSKIILENFDFHLFTEEFFEVLSCYFPVDFTPPEGENFFVKKDDLVLGLRSCFVSTKEFAPYAVPLFLEKLSSSLLDAKKDVLITFTECLKLYEHVFIEPFLTEIWLCLRKDYLFSDDKELSSLYLNFIHQFVCCLSNSPTLEYLLQLVELLIKDCLLTLKDPEMSIAEQCGNLILCTCNASPATFYQVISGLIPPIQSSLEKYSSSKQRCNLLELITKIYSIEIPDQNVPKCLVEFTDQLTPLLYSLLESESKALSIISLKCLTKILNHLNWFKCIDNTVFMLHIMKLPLSKLLDSEMVSCFESVIALLSVKCSELFNSLCIEKLKCSISKNDDPLITNQSINLLQHCALDQSYTESIVTFLVNILSDFTHGETVLLVVLDSLTEILDCCTNKVSKNLVLLPLVGVLLTVKYSDLITSKMALCLSSCYQKLSTKEAEEVVFSSCQLVVSYESNKFFDLSVNRLEKLREIIVLNRAVLSQVSLLLLKNANHISVLLDELCVFITNFIDDHFASECAGICLASILNKIPDETLIGNQIGFINRSLLTNPKASIIVLLWLCKAVVLNWQYYTSGCIELLLKFLQDESAAFLLSENFQIIFNPYPKAFDKTSNSNIKIMYKQHFSQTVLPPLITYYNDGSDAIKPYLMTVISITLQISPAQMYQKHLESLTPLLLHSLTTSASDPNITSTLSIIDTVLDQNKTLIADYIMSLIPRLLLLSNHSCMEIRILSIKCLGKISKYPTHLVYSMKDEVIKGLKPRRDDKKRLVRKEAVRCTNLWFLMSN